jgi:hypothetical protein
VLGEELTFKCNWQSNLKYLPRTRDHIPFRSTKGWNKNDIDNLCTQRRFEEVARRGSSELDYIWEDEFCLEEEKTQISVNTDTNILKIDGISYESSYDNSKRECFGEENKICKYQVSGFRFEDDALKIWVQNKYQLEECPIGLEFKDVFVSEDSERRDELLTNCFGFVHSGNDWKNDLQGSTKNISINRNTLDFTQNTRDERISFKDGKFIKEIFKSGAFYDVDMSDFATEYGVCEVFKKQF